MGARDPRASIRPEEQRQQFGGSVSGPMVAAAATTPLSTPVKLTANTNFGTPHSTCFAPGGTCRRRLQASGRFRFWNGNASSEQPGLSGASVGVHSAPAARRGDFAVRLDDARQDGWGSAAPQTRIRRTAKVTGAAVYTADLEMPQALFGVTVRADCVRGRFAASAWIPDSPGENAPSCGLTISRETTALRIFLLTSLAWPAKP